MTRQEVVAFFEGREQAWRNRGAEQGSAHFMRRTALSRVPCSGTGRGVRPLRIPTGRSSRSFPTGTFRVKAVDRRRPRRTAVHGRRHPCRNDSWASTARTAGSRFRACASSPWPAGSCSTNAACDFTGLLIQIGILRGNPRRTRCHYLTRFERRRTFARPHAHAQCVHHLAPMWSPRPPMRRSSIGASRFGGGTPSGSNGRPSSMISACSTPACRRKRTSIACSCTSENACRITLVTSSSSEGWLERDGIRQMVLRSKRLDHRGKPLDFREPVREPHREFAAGLDIEAPEHFGG